MWRASGDHGSFFSSRIAAQIMNNWRRRQYCIMVIKVKKIVTIKKFYISPLFPSRSVISFSLDLRVSFFNFWPSVSATDVLWVLVFTASTWIGWSSSTTSTNTWRDSFNGFWSIDDFPRLDVGEAKSFWATLVGRTTFSVDETCCKS